VTRLLSGFNDCLARFANGVAILSLVAMTLLIVVEVFSRTLLGASTLVGEEWPSYLLVYLVFFGMVYTFKDNGFIRVEILFGRSSQHQQDVLTCISLVLATGFAALFDYQLITFVLSSYLENIKSISFSETPLVIPQIAMPIGMTLLTLQLLQHGIQSFVALIRS
jgi:TRAP-type C4-dicarboxylate transport system permease small subunit